MSTLTDGNVIFESLEIGDMVVVDPDQWMLGDRYVIKEVGDDFAVLELYCCGQKYPWQPFKISKKDLEDHCWIRDEKIEMWKKKFEK